MKKIFMTIVAVAAIAACSKTEVQYENSAEIGFAPAVKNVTKGAMTGDMATANPNQELGIWAYWNYKDGALQDSHNELYLNDATFAKKTVQIPKGDSSTEVTAWGGKGYAYPWPTNGTLRFAGYTKFTTSGSVSYSGVAEDKITFTDYSQTSGFDLCWFNKTAEYNNRTYGAAIPVTLHHALSWLKFMIKGEGTTVGWKITSIVLNDIASSGTGVCQMDNSTPAKPVAEWTCNTYETDVTLRSTELELTADFVDIETVSNGGKSTTSDDFLVIPQTINDGNQSGNARTQHTLTINYSFPVGANWKTDSKTVKLDLTGTDNKWKSGFKYTYKLTFKSNEILVSPSYGGWDTTVNQGVTIE